MTKPAALENARRIDLPMQTREAPIEQVDVETRTVTLVWTTGAAVRRYSWMRDCYYDEVLLVDKNAVDLSRLNGGAPLLNSHGAYDLAGIIGVVERAWIDKGQGYAEVRFPRAEDNPEADQFFRQVKDKIIRNVSVGYRVQEYQIDKKDDANIEIWRAVKWQPMEISLVPVPADAGAGTRSQPPVHACIIKETNMTTKTAEPGAADPASEESTRAAIAAANAAAATAERTRSKIIRDRTRAARLPEDFADKLVESGVAIEHVGDKIVDELAARGPQNPAPPRIGEDNTDPAVIAERMVTALAARASANFDPAARIAMTPEARQYAGLGMLGMLAELARTRGEKIDPRLRPAQIYDALCAVRSLSTSDFPLLLANAANKIMLSTYALAEPTYRKFFSRKTFHDFRPHSFLRNSDFPTLLQKLETGEYKYGALAESGQLASLGVYGRVVLISRELLINDDMGAFAALPQSAARRASQFENTAAYALFALNSGGGPTITEPNSAGVQTAVNMWHATHNNLTASGTVISIASLGIGYAAIQKQRSLAGDTLNLVPVYLVTGPDQRTVAMQFTMLLGTVPATQANANPFAGTITPVIDANLTGTAWYMFAAPGDGETFIYGYLDGQEGPRFESETGFMTDGVKFKSALDFGVGGVDYRGTYKNVGA